MSQHEDWCDRKCDCDAAPEIEDQLRAQLAEAEAIIAILKAELRHWRSDEIIELAIRTAAMRERK